MWKKISSVSNINIFCLFCIAFYANICNTVFAQTHVIDSIQNVLRTEKDDTNKVNTLNILSEKLWRTGNYTTSLLYAKKAETLAEKLDVKNGLTAAYRSIGIIYEEQGNYSDAMQYDIKALSINKETNNKQGIAYNLGEIGIIYGEEGNYPKALEYFFQALKISQELGNKRGTAANLDNLGIIYFNQNNFSKALEYNTKAFSIFKEIGNKQGTANCYANIGDIYTRQHNYKKALEYEFNAISIHKAIGDLHGTALDFSNIASDYVSQNNYHIALTYYDSAMNIHKSLGEKEYYFITLNSLGFIYIKQKNYSKAKIYLDSCLTFSNNTGNKKITDDVYGNMVLLDSALGNYKARIEDYKNYITYRDSLINEANTKKSVQTEMNFEFEQKQAVEKAQQDKKDVIAQQERNKQVIIRNSFIGGFVLMLALAFFIFRGYRQKQKANIIISQQKEAVEKSQKKVMDSIKYAKKIQYSLLPSDEEIKKYVSDFFVCFLPKDIVSGDFYWFHHTDELSYFAVVDCTGHGVPGACMSMLANSFLNELVIEKKIHDPSEILEQMHQLVFNTLHQQKGDEYSQDGMDISLVVINYRNKTAKFSGARNNAFIINNNTITTLKATPKSIGGLSLTGEIEHIRRFTSQEFYLIPGMLLIMATDGIVDQLNADDEKFGRKRFNALMKSFGALPANKRASMVETTINKWKDTLHQQDDILVMGVQI
jgi:tetratricopeptide (TPR) repeat protein